MRAVVTNMVCATLACATVMMLLIDDVIFCCFLAVASVVCVCKSELLVVIYINVAIMLRIKSIYPISMATL